MEILEYDPTIDGVLESWMQRLGTDFAGYRNHVYRVFNYARVLTKDAGRDSEIIAVASAFHDLGVWTHSTLDYLEPIRAPCHRARVRRRAPNVGAYDRADDRHAPQAAAVSRRGGTARRGIPARGPLRPRVRGAVRAGVDRGYARELNARFPDEGFRGGIARLLLGWMVTHPRRPLPMMRL
jgi:hypothetical protein